MQGRQPYIVFEYVPGKTLAEHLAQQGRCTPHDAVALMVDVLDGLQAAHQAGIVHRDLKPSNIMIDTQRHARVMDFGMADGPALTLFLSGPTVSFSSMLALVTSSTV